MNSRLVWISAVCLCLVTSPARAQAWTGFTRAFDTYATADSIVGGSAILIRDGRTVQRHNYGFADRAARRLGFTCRTGFREKLDELAAGHP